MDIQWGIVTIPVHRKDSKLTVVCITETYSKSYWVRYGGLIDATIREKGRDITGVGAKKYENEIKLAIDKFEADLLNNRINWEQKDKKNLKVINTPKKEEIN